MEKVTKHTLSEDYLREMWLRKYHNTTVKEVVEKHPEEVKSPEWFKLYPCTQEQHDEWVEEAKSLLKKVFRMSKYRLDRAWGLIYLNTAPYIKG